MNIPEIDTACMSKAIDLAMQADQQKNLPIGSVIRLETTIIAEGKNSIWYPEISLYRHAEMEALGMVPKSLWDRAGEMVLYTTLEPCLMCLGAILLHRIGVVVFGSLDPFGGAGSAPATLPPYFRDQFARTRWIGPAFPYECDPLYQRIQTLVRRPGREQDLPSP